jgi:hypothetical protein
MIRIAKVTSWTTMPSGMYARSEGPETPVTYTVVHPDDSDRVATLNQLQGKGFAHVAEHGSQATRSLIADYPSLHDLIELGEEAPEMADSVMDEIDAYWRQAGWRKGQPGDFLEMTPETDSHTWMRIDAHRIYVRNEA